MGCGPKGRRFESCQAYLKLAARYPPGGFAIRTAVPAPSAATALVYFTSWRGVRVVEGAALEKR